MQSYEKSMNWDTRSFASAPFPRLSFRLSKELWNAFLSYLLFQLPGPDEELSLQNSRQKYFPVIDNGEERCLT